MAKEGFAGHGGAEDVGTWIWEAMCKDLEALLRVGILKHIEEMPMFVEGVGHDITSDITTRIIFGPLADFTFDVLQQFPEFTSGSHEVAKFPRQVWDADNRAWTQQTVTLPIVEGKPLLLMPSSWVRGTLLMYSGRFYETSVLTYAQDEQSVVAHDGKVIRTPKDRLRTQHGLQRGIETIRAVTLRAESQGDDLIGIFRRFVADRYRPAA